MLEDNLLKLCLREFVSLEDATKANPYGSRHSVIVYRDLSPISVFEKHGRLPDVNQGATKEVRPQRLPSGLWAWLPSDAEDLESVARIRLGMAEGTTKILSKSAILDVYLSDEDFKNYLKSSLRNDLLREFGDRTKDSAVYRVSVSITETTEKYYGSAVVKISGRLLYC